MPPPTLHSQRALCFVELFAQEKLLDVLDAFFEAYWITNNFSITTPGGSIPVLERILGQEAVSKYTQSLPESKSRLAKNTDEAFDSGAFGLPWFSCTDTTGETKRFWGFDRLGQVVQFLGLDAKVERGMRAML